MRGPAGSAGHQQLAPTVSATSSGNAQVGLLLVSGSPRGTGESDTQLLAVRPNLLLDRESVSHSGSAAHCSKIDTQETHHGGKGRVVLFREPATREGGRLMSRRPSSLSRPSQRVLKGKAGEEGGGLWAGEAGVRVVTCTPTRP